MPKYRFQGPRFPKTPRLPSGPRLPRSPVQEFLKKAADPLYPLTWEYWDEQQKKRGQYAAAYVAMEQMRRLEEENRLRALGYSDKTLFCAKCGSAFVFTVRDQAFFLSKGFNEPKYCSKTCRDRARMEREQGQKLDALQSININCIDCGKSFVFSKGEQEFFKSKGFKNPVRCPECRAKRKNK